MKTSELRQLYLNFFKEKQHAVIPSASLIPENDATVLFTTAGMHPLVPFLLGAKHPKGKRLVDCQKCLRTGDIDDVGDNRHLTFFEMLGNWSLGDYFKKEAIEWSFEFLTDKKYLGLDPKRLFVTVFKGENDIPYDEESAKSWQEQFAKVGITAEVSLNGKWENENTRIFALGKDDNWWGLASGGPCGPCSEMFYDTTPAAGLEIGKTHDDLVKSFRLFEIWNDVFMQYEGKAVDGKLSYVPLIQQNVDTGMGLERTVAVLNGQTEVFEIEDFQILFEKITELSGKKYDDNRVAFRVIADHVRAATLILGDEHRVEPSNLDQGYILRRLIRRAIRYGKQLGINEIFTFKIAEIVIKNMQDVYPELKTNKDFIINQLVKEEEKFSVTLEKGLNEYRALVNKKYRFPFSAELLERQLNTKKPSAVELAEFTPTIIGEDSFYLFQSFGFPIELIRELAAEDGLKISEESFWKEFKKHQELSRSGAEQKFKGGLADTSETTARLHTATHLLQAALRKVLGTHVEQRGSNITAERLRFDFTHGEKMTDEQKKQVEDLVNEWIQKDFEVKCEELPYAEAKTKNVMGLFENKYGEVVKVYTIGDVSGEICGGPHANRTGELGKFKIVKEEASSSGVRRIKATLE